MTSRGIHPSRRVFSGSNVLWAIATALTEIKDADDLTDADIGAVLGKSPDQARAYRRGEAMMDAEAFGRGKREWNGRFTGYYDRLCENSRPGVMNDRACESTVLKAVLALSLALADDNGISTEEVRQNRSTLENARDAIDAQLSKLRPAA